MLEITKKINGNTAIALITGRIDSTNANEFDAKLTALDTEERLVLDMEGLEYTSSAGLRVILKCRKNHEDLELINVSSEVYEILDMTGFTEMMNVKKAYRRVSVEGAEVIGQGANGKVYRVDPDTVVKVYLNEDSLADIEHERDVARKALVLGIPTAISYDVVKVDNHYASMFEMINANSFSKILAKNPEKVDEYAVMYVDLLKLIHSTKVPQGQLPDQKQVLLGWVKDLASELPANIYEKLTKMCNEIPYSDYMIHGDYHTKNVMLQNGEVILIDMDTLAIGHPVLEFASIYNAYLGFNALDHEHLKEFLGIEYETGEKLWNKTLELYYGTTDKAVLQLRADQAACIGFVRMLRRTIRRNGDPAFIKYCRESLCSLVEKLDSLI